MTAMALLSLGIWGKDGDLSAYLTHHNPKNSPQKEKQYFSN